MKEHVIPVPNTCPTLNTMIGRLESIEVFVGKIKDGDKDMSLYDAIDNALKDLRLEIEEVRASNLALRTFGNRAYKELAILKERDKMIINQLKVPDQPQ